MRDANDRLKTFTLLGWPLKDVVDPTEAAEAGFFYTGRSDILECFYCSVHIGKWEPKDRPVFEHIKFSRYCRFTLNLDTGNIPVVENPYKDVGYDEKNYDVID